MNKNKEKFIEQLTKKLSLGSETEIENEKKSIFLILEEAMNEKLRNLKKQKLILDEYDFLMDRRKETGDNYYLKQATLKLKSL